MASMTRKDVFLQNIKLNNTDLRDLIVRSEFYLKPTGNFAYHDDGGNHPWNQEGLCITIGANEPVIHEWQKLSKSRGLKILFTDALDPEGGYDVTSIKFNVTASSEPIEMGNRLLESINQISTRDASFTSRGADEKLELLNNTIENILKQDGKFVSIDNAYFMGLLTDEQIKSFRQQTQCFRHASDQALLERVKLDEKQKRFLVNFGVLIVVTLSENRFK